MTAGQMVINFPPMHPSQRAAASSRARYRVLACGRRWGKTRLGSALSVAEGLQGGRVFWVAPTYKLTAPGWRMIQRLSAPIPGAEIRKAERSVTFASGGEVHVRSADDPNSLRGDGLNLAILDECAFMLEDAWIEALRPALSDRKGRAVFISTPKRRNWFYTLWMRGQDGGDYQAWQLPTSNNPYIDADEIQTARLELPDDVFAQEYLAEFLESGGAVFRNVGASMTAGESEPAQHAGHRIVAGVDWGKQHDYTAVSVGCATCRCEIERARSNRIDYTFQVARIADLWRKWDIGTLLVETNAMGAPIFEQLQREGLPVSGFETTASSKPPLIESLSLAFDRREWAWQDDKVWTLELEAYERRVNNITGRSSYSAPEGMHDDTVMARALCLQAAQVGIVSIDNPFYD